MSVPFAHAYGFEDPVGYRALEREDMPFAHAFGLEGRIGNHAMDEQAPFAHAFGLEDQLGYGTAPSYEAKNYLDDAIPHEMIDEPLAPFAAYIVRGADRFVVNIAFASRADQRTEASKHEIGHYFLPNWHMPPATYESANLLGTGTVHSEQPHTIATFTMRDLDIARAYANRQY